jgi:hypothetical protein
MATPHLLLMQQDDHQWLDYEQRMHRNRKSHAEESMFQLSPVSLSLSVSQHSIQQ